ncbi:hypothetical protein DL98DRAFT_574726 [Cadophora sp. DSE1049]|nr:hypothetical protein DL98DRAFT_574726 [Cadophora sp. DSE1049]
MSALFQTPSLTWLNMESFAFHGFMHGGDLDMATDIHWDDSGFEAAVLLPTQDEGSCPPSQDAGDGVSMLHLAYSAAGQCVDTPVHSKAQDYGSLEGVLEHVEFESKCQNFGAKWQEKPPTRFQHKGLSTKSLDEQEPYARRPKAPARATLGIREAIEATSRLNAALDATQPTKTELHIQPKTASEPRGVDLPATVLGRVSARDPSTTPKTVLASPFQTVLCQPKRPSSTAVRMQSIPDNDLELFDFSAYLHKELLDQHPTSDAESYTESISSLSGNTWHENLESPVHLKDIPALNQHASTWAILSSDSVPLTLPLRDRYALTAGPPQYTQAVRPLGHIVDSNINGISMMNNFTKSAYLNETQSGRPRRARKACNRCRKKKIRCVRKGEEECVPLS